LAHKKGKEEIKIHGMKSWVQTEVTEMYYRSMIKRCQRSEREMQRKGKGLKKKKKTGRKREEVQKSLHFR